MNQRAAVLDPASTSPTPDTRGSGIRRAKTPRDGESFRGTTRFQPRALLGQGGMGVVYRVHDVEMGVDVALKTLPAMNPAEIVHLKNEFRVLLGLDHPNLIELHELIVDGDEAFFTMELLDGGSFVTHVQGREVRDSPATGELRGAWLDRLGVALGQLVQGLTYLHHRGKLHCDIKPSNVQVTSTGRVVLLDFGLATAILADGEQPFGNGDMLGTVEYMAPEQAWGTELTPAADWYAVGSMLYEALTGVLPFRGEFEEIVTNKTRIRPAPPSKVNPAIPKALSDLVLALLEPAPEKRASGKSILEFISSISGTAVEFDTEMVGRDAPFVGREAEMAELHALHKKTQREQRPRVVRVEGPSGMGKSELVRRFIADLERNASAVVLRGRCHPRESVAYKAFDGVIDALGNYLATLSSRELPALAPPHTQALLRVFHALSVLQDLSPTPATADPPEPQELRRRAFEGLALLLESISRRSSVVIWIDDLQWGDVDSLSLLHELLVSIRGPVLFIIGYRAEEVERNSILQSLERITKVLPAEATTHLRLGPLQEVSARALAASVLGRRADANVLNDIAAEAAGSPFFLAELARYAARRADNDPGSQELRPRAGIRIGMTCNR